MLVVTTINLPIKNILLGYLNEQPSVMRIHNAITPFSIYMYIYQCEKTCSKSVKPHIFFLTLICWLWTSFWLLCETNISQSAGRKSFFCTFLVILKIQICMENYPFNQDLVKYHPWLNLTLKKSPTSYEWGFLVC